MEGSASSEEPAVSKPEFPTDAFSKKMGKSLGRVLPALAYYNFSRIHRTVRVTPAMEAGVTNRVWNVLD